MRHPPKLDAKVAPIAEEGGGEALLSTSQSVGKRLEQVAMVNGWYLLIMLCANISGFASWPLVSYESTMRGG